MESHSRISKVMLVCVSWGCLNKPPQTGGLKATEIWLRPVLEARGLESGAGMALPPPGEGPSPVAASGGSWHPWFEAA